MIRFLILIFFCLNTIKNYSQVFTNQNIDQISSNSTLNSVINVQEEFIINCEVSVCLDITHTFNSDLDISLQSPSGISIELSSDNGSSFDNYIGTCFNMNASELISNSFSPFYGDYIPEGNLTQLIGTSSYGDWILIINDDQSGDEGTLNFWSLDFNCNTDCSNGEIFTLNLYDSYGDGWISNYQSNSGQTHIISIDGEVFGNNFTSGYSYSQNICLDTTCHFIEFINNGQFFEECSFEILNTDNNLIFSSQNLILSNSFGQYCENNLNGCTDSTATNYDFTSLYDNSSCEYEMITFSLPLTLYLENNLNIPQHYNDPPGFRSHYIDSITHILLPQLIADDNDFVLDFYDFEKFQNLKTLHINFNQILVENFDITYLPQSIEILSLSHSDHIYFYDFEDLNNLTSLYIENSSILDYSLTLSNLNLLSVKDCGLDSINLSYLINLKKLVLDDNNLQNLNLEYNDSLEYLSINNSAYGSANPYLYDSTYYNSISHIDLTNLSKLEWFYCSHNNIETLNLNFNNNLKFLQAQNNNLLNINLANNFNMTSLALDYNDNLHCIKVSDIDYYSNNFPLYSNYFNSNCIIFDCLNFQNDLITYDATSIYNCDGVVVSNTFGGIQPYNYSLNGFEINDIFTVCSGNNVLTITDSIGCELVDTFFVGPVSLGCIDFNACNFSEIANTDDGSCIYPDSIYDCFGNCLNDNDFDGICDELEINGCTDENAPNFNELATDDDGSCIECNISVEYILYNSSSNLECNGLIGLIINNQVDYIAYVNNEALNTNYYTEACYGENIILIEDDLDCIFNDTINVGANTIYGCTDSTAINYNVFATIDDGSCEYEELENPCDITPSELFVDNIIHNRVNFNWSQPEVSPSHYMIRYRPVGTSSWTVMTAGPVNNNPFNGTSRTRYFMEPETTYEWNIRARVLNEDGSTNCQSPWSASSQFTTLPACPNLENLSVSTEANWVTLNADAPGEEWGVWQSKAKMKELGTNSFRYANGDSYGNINVLKGNFSPNTEYQWHTKAWCTGNVDELGNSDPQYHSGWGDFSYFTTEEICDKMPVNLSTSSNGANTAITMSWDLPLSGTPDHYFLELNNENTGQQWLWNNIPGIQTSKSKFGLTQGEYSWRIRGACGTNGTTWATIFSEPVYYTLGGARFDNDIVSDLNVYPNPSRDFFNISFSSDELQSISIRVVNVIGEEIFKQELIDFDGTYTHELDMSKKSKGVYFLEISSEKGTVNSKMVLQ